MVAVGLLLILFSITSPAAENKVETLPAAVLWYTEMAAQGDVDAKYNLGMMNEVGWSIPVDIKKAIRWYREAAKQGHAEAELRLGMLYYLGLGTKQSKLKGESWIRKSAKHKHSFAGLLNKELFKEDAPDTLDQKKVLSKVRETYLQDEKKAVNHLRRLVDNAQQKSASQQQKKEKSTIRERRETRVIIAAAKEGITKGENKPRVSKQASKPTPKVKKKEFERIKNVVPDFIGKKSLEENRTLARGNLATIRLQANKGLASAQYNLGRMHELGVKVSVDRLKALSWYEKAAAQDYADAQYRLAISKLYGKSVERDEQLGRKWLTAAADNGHQVAKNLLISLTNQEGGIDVGNSLAVSWYLERAVAGNAEAALNLGRIFENGWGAVPDLREAIKWYRHSKMLGSEVAEKFLRDSKTQLAFVADNVRDVTEGETENFRPPDWIAYLLAAMLAIGVVFWPLFRRGRVERKQELASVVPGKRVHRQEPPFG